MTQAVRSLLRAVRAQACTCSPGVNTRCVHTALARVEPIKLGFGIPVTNALAMLDADATGSAARLAAGRQLGSDRPSEYAARWCLQAFTSAEPTQLALDV